MIAVLLLRRFPLLTLALLRALFDRGVVSLRNVQSPRPLSEWFRRLLLSGRAAQQPHSPAKVLHISPLHLCEIEGQS